MSPGEVAEAERLLLESLATVEHLSHRWQERIYLGALLVLPGEGNGGGAGRGHRRRSGPGHPDEPRLDLLAPQRPARRGAAACPPRPALDSSSSARSSSGPMSARVASCAACAGGSPFGSASCSTPCGRTPEVPSRAPEVTDRRDADHVGRGPVEVTPLTPEPALANRILPPRRGRSFTPGEIKVGGLRIGFSLALLTASVMPFASAAAVRNGPLPAPLVLADNWWRADVSAAPLDPGSAAFISFIGPTRGLHPDFGGEVTPCEIYGFPYVTVDAAQPKRAVSFDYSDESDGVDYVTGQGFPFYPIPDEAATQCKWIEGGAPGNQGGGGDRHMLIYDSDNQYLYELYALHWDGASWTAGSGAFFDLKTDGRRPEGWTSADAAGLAILPGLVRYDEVSGPSEITHAIRFTVRATNGFVYPASHRRARPPARCRWARDCA